jgi:hypothetical protein
MPISFRVSELKGHFVYAFEEGDEADSFQSCVSTVNARYCERKHPSAAKIPAAEPVNGQPSKHEPSRRDNDSESWYRAGT